MSGRYLRYSMSLAVLAWAAGLFATLGAAPGQGSEAPKFLHALDNAPLEFNLRPNQTYTPAVEAFHKTAENPYRGDPDAIAAGKKIYGKYCKACHLDSGKGRIGPSLVDDKWKYPRTGTDQGKFEIIYAGGAGAMQAFGLRMDQDDILKVMAYLDVLGKN